MKKVTYIICLALLFLSTHAKATNGNLAIQNIPEALKHRANAVVRNYELDIEIKSPSDVKTTEHRTITILNKDGDDLATIREMYNSLSRIEYITASVYDKDGNWLHSVDHKDLLDVGYRDNATFYDDTRFKLYQFDHEEYPYTCVIEIVRTQTTTFLLPFWEPQLRYDCSVQQSGLTVSCPRSIKMNYRLFNFSAHPTDTLLADGMRHLTLQANDITARRKPDVFTPASMFEYPAFVVTTDKLSLNGLQGANETWKDYGKFMYEMHVNRDTLPEKLKSIVHSMTDTCSSVAGKVNLLYSYLEQNTRYLQIYLGIGGWQPHNATFVADKGYGDCKDLSNYMKAMLKEAGITAYAALAFAGERQTGMMLANFPFTGSFNHEILCVPTTNDTIWLECTSKNDPAGYMSTFTSNRNVLLLTPSGGEIAHTPCYTENDNLLSRNAVVHINEQNELSAAITQVHAGRYWDWEHEYATVSPKTESHFNKMFTIPSYKTGAYTFNTKTTKSIPAISENIAITGTGCVSRTGGRIFLTPRIFNSPVAAVTESKSRTDSFQLFESRQVLDTITYVFQGDYVAEMLPASIDRDYPFASYHLKVVFEQGNQVKIMVCYKQKAGVYAPNLFDSYVNLAKELNSNASYGEVVLNKKS